jgi:hypothetical protein
MYNERIATFNRLIQQGLVTLPPGVTVQQRVLAEVQRQYPGWQP